MDFSHKRVANRLWNHGGGHTILAKQRQSTSKTTQAVVLCNEWGQSSGGAY